MKISPTKHYAVLTGDVVDSSKLSKEERKALPGALKRAARETRKAFPEAVPLDIEVFRGDSWQLLVADTERSLRVALHLRACLRSSAERGRGLDTRIAVAIGGIDFVPAKKVSEGDGEAYRASGAALEQLPGGCFLDLVLAGRGQLPNVAAIVRLLDALMQDWTGKQSRAMAGLLRGWTHEKIAAEWPGDITQPAVTKHLGNAHWSAVQEALHYCETVLREGVVAS